MTCAQGLLRLLWGGGARSWSATGLNRLLMCSPRSAKMFALAAVISSPGSGQCYIVNVE